MKPVENVSIGGYVFSLETDACETANEYLSKLETFYSKIESGSEVMEGIEERMAELLLEQRGNGSVVTLPMVEKVVAILGRPEAIEEESVQDDGQPHSDSSAPVGEEDPNVRKKLYRDSSEGKVAGVCAGLGIYLGIDSTVFRILFVVLTLAGCGVFLHRGWAIFPDYFMPLLYLILWICMPVAKTVKQRDEMRGEGGTVDDISARIQSAAKEIEEAASNVAKSDSAKAFWKLLALCIGIVFLVAGVSGVVSLGCVTIGDNFLSKTFFLNKFLEEVAREAPLALDMFSYPPLVAALAVVVVIPFIALIYAGIMLMFDLKAPKWHPGLCLFVIWLIALTVLAVFSVMFFARGTI